MTDIEDAIAQYRRDLTAEAELARGDLAEIEDHLRALIDELRAGGLPATEAVAEAARRLGDPRQLAREHARVRTPFGARISRLRAWSATLLLAPFPYLIARSMRGGLASYNGLEIALSVIALVGLAARLPWARAIVLGSLLSVTGWNAIAVATWPADAFQIAQLVCYAGAIAFLVPWRRGELSASALALVLLGPAYTGAATMLSLFFTGPDHHVLADPWGVLALAGVLAAAGGGLLRARWAALPAAVAAFALVMAVLEVWPLYVRLHSPDVWRAVMLATLSGGAACAGAAAVMMWRHARSTLGTLHGVLG
ncbi:MAG: permease prefix domain 1-containing protein [Acidobacteriota bacterium]